MFRNLNFQRATSAFVMIALTNLTLAPLARAQNAYDAAEKAGLLAPAAGMAAVSQQPKRYGGSPDERFAQLLSDIHDDLKAAAPQTAFGTNAQHAMQAGAGRDIAAKATNIRAKHAQLKTLYASIDDGFASTAQRLKTLKLPAEIQNRQAAAFGQYQSRKAEFSRLMTALEKESDNSSKQLTAMADLGAYLSRQTNKQPHQYTNPKKLPFGMPGNTVRAPHTTTEQFQASLFPPKHDDVMLAGAIPANLQFVQTVLPALPNAADLAETDDIQMTQAIRDKAAALNKNPVAIYNWVRNNIAFIPSYGSIQGSDMTLANKRGNAFDTASLLIALYRASGIPARYAYGTIEVPAAQVMNWVGGVGKPAAAQNLLGQGGIPNVALVSGGTVKAIRMEHVWVQAYVDYIPSRGAVNKSPDTWVPVDASFKQYTFTKGMDIKANVPVNGEELSAQILQGATVDEAQGYVQNLNHGAAQAQYAAYQTRLKTYISSQKSGATVGDVVGMQTIKAEDNTVLLGTLAYKTTLTANTFQTLPDNLRWRFKTNIYAADNLSDSSSPIIEIDQTTARLAGKKITLSFAPASPADQELINSYMPKPHADGTPIQMSELPPTLPAYLIKLKAEFRIDGQLVAQTAGNFTMGSMVRQSNQYFNPANASWDGGDDNDITVGEFNAIGLDLQGIGESQLKSHQARLDATKALGAKYQLNPGDKTPISGLTKEDLAGDIQHSGILAYFALVDSNDRLAALGAGEVKSYRLPSYGRFFTTAQPHYFFGMVRSVGFPGVTMDVDYLRYHVAANDDDNASVVRFMRQAGSLASSAEHSIPEMMFANQNLPRNDSRQPQGVSAIKALGLAASQGQKIYTLTQGNRTLHASILQSLAIAQDVKHEISDALSAGKEVTVHAADVSVGGWTGSGYVVLDPLTGAGAYKIAGGANGGELLFAGFGLIGLSAALYAFFAFGGGIAIAVGLFVIIHLIFLIVALELAVNACVGVAVFSLAGGPFAHLAKASGILIVDIITWVINMSSLVYSLHPCTI
ncbi:transglutaminase-like domain-containing protein [Massilia scottii]|uniref:transglutaminase-like domain-containing protein n=1 Tax=Massilia scottii TaxID=3057166 RepID=UPI0027966E38|nr:transglutaminase-like domain-containing protein [Massilia sp. CCM 9029]MDQ1830489.1 transglutaminase-like domain-containing protein [Massilia sp. CCM 9029]